MLRKILTKAVTTTYLPKNPYPGEMLPIERLRLYQWVRHCSPKVVLEVGSGVGGSTFYISEAIREHGGVLHTCDPLRRPPEHFLKRFENTLCYHPLRSDELISWMRHNGIAPDFIFFDGPEIPELALDDIQSLEEWIEPGCCFAMHDWEQAGGANRKIVSVKAKLIRPDMENSSDWVQEQLLSGHQKNAWWTKGSFDSVGLCLYRFRPKRVATNKAA